MRQRTWQRAFDVQLDRWRWITTHPEDWLITADVRQWPRETALDVLAMEEETLLTADPIFVSAEMCDLIENAARTFRPEPWQAPDLMTGRGFLLYERAIDVLRGEPGDQILLHYTGFAWSLGRKLPGETPTGVFITTYHRWEDEPRWPSTLPALTDDVVGIFEFGTAPPSHHRTWWALAQATLRLMQEFRPASRATARPDRATRRAAERAGFPERTVTVVHLRRSGAPHERLGGSANYSHRFIVSGHWRNQWCPTLNAHRQTWISPYVKGPADKPLRPPHGRAFVLNR